MTHRHVAAVAVGLATILLALAQPLWIRVTGDEVALAIRPVDPLSFFRGNYVDLTYMVDADAPRTLNSGDAAFVVFDDGRPASAVRVEAARPDLGPGETCIRGRVRSGNSVGFPELEQFFVTADQGRELERNLAGLVGVIKTTGSCRAVLVDLEPR